MAGHTAIEKQVEALKVELTALDRLVGERFLASGERVRAALESADKAIQKADYATDKRFDALAEFRQTLAEESRLYANKDAVDQQFATMREKMDDLSGQVARLLVSLLLTVVSVLLAALVFAATR